MNYQGIPLIGTSSANEKNSDRFGMTGILGRVLVTACLMSMASAAHADEFITMSNGMTCWRNPSGFTYGCSGGVNTGDSGFNDTRTGDRYERIGPNQAIDTRSGQPMEVPPVNRSRHRNDQEEW